MRGRVLTAALVAAVVALGAGLAPAGAQNLFTNPGFEEGEAQGPPAGWAIYPFAAAPGGTVQRAAKAYRGQASVVISQDLAPALFGIFSRPVKLSEAGTEELLLTGYFRTEKEPAPQICLVGYEDGFLQKEWATPFLQSECQTLAASKDWSLFSWRFRAIPGVQELVAIFRVRAAGKLWLDEVSLQPYPAEVAARVSLAGVVAEPGNRRVVEVELNNRADRERSVEVVAWALSEKRKATQASGEVRVAAGQTRTVRLDYKYDYRDAHLLRVIVQDGDSGQVYDQSDTPVGGLVTARIASPAFRSALIEGVPTPRLAVEGIVNTVPESRGAVRVKAELLGGGPGCVFTPVEVGDPGRYRLEAKTPDLVSGNHTLRVTATLGELQQVLDLPLFRYVASIGQVGFDEQRRLWLGGKPLFPRVIYGIEDPADLKQAAAAGFNTAVVPSTRASQDLQELARAAGMAILVVGQSIDEDFWQHQERKWGVAGACLGWLPYSRADVRNIPPVEVGKLYTLLRRVSPAHPVVSILGSPSLAPYYAETADIQVAWSSPVPTSPLRALGDMIGVLRGSSAGARPIWATVQACGNGHYVDDILGPEKTGRPPTPAEMEALAFLGLIHGADGLLWYAYRIGSLQGAPGYDLRRDAPELWAALPRLNLRLSWLGPVLLDGERKLLPPAAEGGVAMAQWKYQDSTYTVAVNMTGKGLVTPLPGFPAGGAAQVMFENRVLAVDGDGEVQESFPPYGVRVYVVG